MFFMVIEGYMLDNMFLFLRCKITFCKADGKRYKRDYIKMRGSLRGIGIGITQLWPAATKAEASSIRYNQKSREHLTRCAP